MCQVSCLDIRRLLPQYKLLLPMQVSSCFSQLLNLHNLSEEISSAQLERAVRIGEVKLPNDSPACESLQTAVHDRIARQSVWPLAPGDDVK